MQRFRWGAPVWVLLILTATSMAHAEKTIKPQGSAWVKVCAKANAVPKCPTLKVSIATRAGCWYRRGGASDRRPGQAACHGDGAARDADPAGQCGFDLSKDQWNLVQKERKIDKTKLKVVKLSYTLCHPAGCTPEVEATNELLDDLSTSGRVCHQLSRRTRRLRGSSGGFRSSICRPPWRG